MADPTKPEQPAIRAEGETTLKIDRLGRRRRVASSHLEIVVDDVAAQATMTSVAVSGSGGDEASVRSASTHVSRFVTRTVDAIERVQTREERRTAPVASIFKPERPAANVRIFPDGSVPCPLCEVGWEGGEERAYGDCLLCHGVGRVMPRTRARFLAGDDDADPDRGEEPQVPPQTPAPGAPEAEA